MKPRILVEAYFWTNNYLLSYFVTDTGQLHGIQGDLEQNSQRYVQSEEPEGSPTVKLGKTYDRVMCVNSGDRKSGKCDAE